MVLFLVVSLNFKCLFQPEINWMTIWKEQEIENLKWSQKIYKLYC